MYKNDYSSVVLSRLTLFSEYSRLYILYCMNYNDYINQHPQDTFFKKNLFHQKQ